MVLPKHLVKPFQEKLGFYSCTVPTFMQYVLAELIAQGDFERHINRVRRKLRKDLTSKD
jgi:GntR family transcriptional regulator/MocR family aminotransferase